MRRDRFDRKVDHTVDSKAGAFERVEVITGVGRRRSWPAEVKARIVMVRFGEIRGHHAYLHTDYRTVRLGDTIPIARRLRHANLRSGDRVMSPSRFNVELIRKYYDKIGAAAAAK